MLRDTYLLISAATLLATAVVVLDIMITAPFYNHTVIKTNELHEGIPELIMLIISIPGWIMLLYKGLKQETTTITTNDAT